nr:MAG TPA: hypothetical protein [Caudoviricetes sp.]
MINELVMANLYIRTKPAWINFIYSVEELDQLIESFPITKRFVVGDFALFDKKLQFALLKVLEDRGNIDIYSSQDISDGILLSRITRVYKEPLKYTFNGIDVQTFEESEKSYFDVATDLSSVSNSYKLFCKKQKKRIVNLIVAVDGKSY